MWTWRAVMVVVAAAVGGVCVRQALCRAQDGALEVHRELLRPTSRQKRRAARIQSRRERKDARLAIAKAEKARRVERQRREMSDEQQRERVESAKMRRVEQYVRVARWLVLRKAERLKAAAEQQKLEQAMMSGLRVVVDLSFVGEQCEREQHSVFKQLGCFYGYLKQCPLDALVSLQVASCGPKTIELCRKHGLISWKIWRHEKQVDELFSAHELVFLSPDAEEVLDELDPSCVYVVGAIADRTVRKGITTASAALYGIRTMRLPVREYLPDARTHILNIDSVLVALNEVVNHNDWHRALVRAVPKRIAAHRNQKK